MNGWLKLVVAIVGVPVFIWALGTFVQWSRAHACDGKKCPDGMMAVRLHGAPECLCLVRAE